MFLGSSMYAIRQSTHFLNSNGCACPQISHTAEHAQIPFSGQLLHLLPAAGKKLMCVFSEGMDLAMNHLYQAWLIAINQVILKRPCTADLILMPLHRPAQFIRCASYC